MPINWIVQKVPRGESNICETRPIFWCPLRLFLLGSDESWKYKTHTEIQKTGRILLEPGSSWSYVSPATQCFLVCFLIGPKQNGGLKMGPCFTNVQLTVAGPFWVPTRWCVFCFVLSLVDPHRMGGPKKWDMVSQISNGAVAGGAMG